LSIEIVNLTSDQIVPCGEMLNVAFKGTDMVERLGKMFPLQPENFLIARDGEQIVGSAAAFNYGPFAAIGLVGVHPQHQRRGIGYAIMAHLVAALEQQGCPIMYLDATEMGAPVYAKLGFVEDGRTYRFSRPAHQPTDEPLPEGITVASADMLEMLAAWDARYFGTSRLPLLEDQERNQPGRILIAHDPAGNLAGLLCAQEAILGPWVATSPAIAEKLLRAALRLEYKEEVRVIFPAANPHTAPLLARYGFVPARNIAHMQRGGSDPRDLPNYYGQTSFMLG
jgi:predicted N-acetyltransferase YhbS